MRFFPRLFSWRPFRFLISGGTALAVNLGLLYLLVDFLRVWYLPAAAIAFSAGILVSFFMQKFFTFGDYARDPLKRQMAFHANLQILNLGINTFLVYIGVDYLRIPYLVVQFLASAMLAASNFLIYRHFVFIPRPRYRAAEPPAT